jgi:hypothetical protein
MRQIKSLWTRPTGWRHPGAEDLWRLSCHRLCEHHGEVTIYTDAQGEAWLRTLKLPERARIVRALDSLSVDPFFWAAGKIYTYSLQETAFIHTDADVVIGRPFARRVMEASLCAERVYHHLPGLWFEKCRAPENWQRDWRKGNGISFNCGMFGGNDIAATRRIASASLQFIRQNTQPAKATRADLANMAAEEWAIARETDPLEVTCYSAMGEGGSMLHSHCASYWHLAGKSKRDPENHAKIRERLARYGGHS